MLKRLCALVIAGATLAACSESSPPTGVLPIPTPVGVSQSVLAQLTCRVDAAAATMSCAPAGPAAASGRSNDLILGGQNVYVKMTSTNVVTTAGVSVTADVTVKNLTGQPWNTGDGTTVDTAGVKVFFQTLPTSPVVISNPTDSAVFTGSSKQPYFKYSGTTLLGADQILTAGETSGTINWNFQLNGATTFTFGVLIVAKMPDETGTLRWVRDTTSKTTAGAYLLSVWGASSTDVWAGGAGGAVASGVAALQHWNGTAWTPYTWNDGDVNGLWGSSSTDVYGAATNKIIHWNGTSWAAQVYTAPNTLISVWGSGATDIYVGGDGGVLAHSNGTTWSNVSGSGIGATESVTTIWGTDSTNVYFGTASSVVGAGLHRYSGGGTWTAIDPGTNVVRAIWGSSATDFYVGADAGVLRHYQSGTWSTVSGFGSGTNDRITGIWGTGANDVNLVQKSGTIWHFNGTSWVSLTNSGVLMAALWGSGNDVFVVGYPSVPTYYGVVIRGMR